MLKTAFFFYGMVLSPFYKSGINQGSKNHFACRGFCKPFVFMALSSACMSVPIFFISSKRSIFKSEKLSSSIVWLSLCSARLINTLLAAWSIVLITLTMTMTMTMTVTKVDQLLQQGAFLLQWQWQNGNNKGNGNNNDNGINNVIKNNKGWSTPWAVWSTSSQSHDLCLREVDFSGGRSTLWSRRKVQTGTESRL